MQTGTRAPHGAPALTLDAQPVDHSQLSGLQELRTTALVHAPAPAPLSGMAMMGVLDELATDEWLAAVKRQSELYDKMCRALITDADEQVADEDRHKPPEQQRRFKKKSAWRKLAKAFRVSTEILSIRRWWELDADGTAQLCAEVVVRATAPWGQHMEAVAGCSTRETKFTSRGPACPECNGPMWDNRVDRNGRPAPDGAPHFRCRDKGCAAELYEADYKPADVGVLIPNSRARAKADNDVPAIAETRATNRAVSNLVGSGEVSAEEIDGGVDVGASDSEQPAAAGRARQQSGGQQQGGGKQDPACPKCGGPMWDNTKRMEENERAGKKPGPQFKCKQKGNDRDCDGLYWKGQWKPAAGSSNDPAVLATEVRKLAKEVEGLDPSVGTRPSELVEHTLAEGVDNKVLVLRDSLVKRRDSLKAKQSPPRHREPEPEPVEPPYDDDREMRELFGDG